MNNVNYKNFARKSYKPSVSEQILNIIYAIVCGFIEIAYAIFHNEKFIFALKISVSLLSLLGMFSLVHFIDCGKINAIGGLLLGALLILPPWFCFRNDR